jgi:three-Cys-motif partner protein
MPKRKTSKSNLQPDLWGGDWTEIKLGRLGNYLKDYQKALKGQPFRKIYVDAFAGKGIREIGGNFSLPALEGDGKAYLDGSPKIALRVEPPFDDYYFVELDPDNFEKLSNLKSDFPDRQAHFLQEEANSFLLRMCTTFDWYRNRAVVFCDPFGMQVNWVTIEAMAKTKAIDLWLLFPLSAVNRMLPRDGKIQEAWRRKLDSFFGTTEWYEQFYETKVVDSLLGPTIVQEKAHYTRIGEFFVNRLQTIFAGVSPNPLFLYDSQNHPLFLLCFAASNEKGAPIALRIANHILEEK